MVELEGQTGVGSLRALRSDELFVRLGDSGERIMILRPGRRRCLDR